MIALGIEGTANLGVGIVNAKGDILANEIRTSLRRAESIPARRPTTMPSILSRR